MKYKIAYIDESAEWINTFYQTFKYDFDILKVHVDSESTVDNIITEIFKKGIDCVITDYLLDEEGNVDFNGNKIVENIKSWRPYFPIIMLTSYEPQAIQNMDDVNIINGKDILDGENEERLSNLKAKIKSNIDRYYLKIKSTENRIEELINKRNTESIEPSEEEELTKLFITMDELEPEGKGMPANLIKAESITKLNDFLSQTREILDELKMKKSKDE